MQLHLTTSSLFGDPRLPQRFWAKVNPNGPLPAHRSDLGPCWMWTGARVKGYGQFAVKPDQIVYAHRLAYETLRGLIPPGLECDHLCRNRACVNPAHIEPVTRRENILRGDGPRVQRLRHARKTHCPQGHPYDAENTGICRGWRYCRTCNRERRRSH